MVQFQSHLILILHCIKRGGGVMTWLVFSWIINALSTDIASSEIYSDKAHETWMDRSLGSFKEMVLNF